MKNKSEGSKLEEILKEDRNLEAATEETVRRVRDWLFASGDENILNLDKDERGWFVVEKDMK